MLQVITNHHEHDILYWWELTPSEKREFDWIERNGANPDEYEFFRYRGNAYCTSDFMPIENNADLKDWDGYVSDSYFSGIVIKYAREDWGGIDPDHVICGLYLS